MLSCIWDNCHQCYIRNSWKKEENTHTNIYAHTGFETYSQMMIVCTEGRKQASKQADLWYNFCPLLKFGLVFLRDWRKGKITRNPRREVHKPTNLAMFLFACPFCSRALNSGKCLNWKKLGTQKVLDTQLVSGCIALFEPTFTWFGETVQNFLRAVIDSNWKLCFVVPNWGPHAIEPSQCNVIM